MRCKQTFLKHVCEGKTSENRGRPGAECALLVSTEVRGEIATLRPGDCQRRLLVAGEARMPLVPRPSSLDPGSSAVTGAGAAPCGQGSQWPVFCMCDKFTQLISQICFLQKC